MPTCCFGSKSPTTPTRHYLWPRQVLGGKRLVEVNPVFEAALREQVAEEREVQRVIEYAAAHGSVQGLTSLPDRLKTVFRTARDICPEWHARMQAAWQRHTDAAVSKTVNLPADASASDVEAASCLARALRKFVAVKQRDGLDAILSGRVKSLDAPGPSNGRAGKTDQEALFKIKCPDCDSAGALAYEEGCLKCHACGYSIC